MLAKIYIEINIFSPLCFEIFIFTHKLVEIFHLQNCLIFDSTKYGHVRLQYIVSRYGFARTFNYLHNVVGSRYLIAITYITGNFTRIIAIPSKPRDSSSIGAISDIPVMLGRNTLILVAVSHARSTHPRLSDTWRHLSHCFSRKDCDPWHTISFVHFLSYFFAPRSLTSRLGGGHVMRCDSVGLVLALLAS